MIKPKGGSAFPRASTQDGGMSLRDWFAGQALAGLLAHTHTEEISFLQIVTSAYKLADDMIEERQKES